MNLLIPKYIYVFKNTDIIQKVFSNNTMHVYENRNSDTTVYLIDVVQMLKKINQPYRNKKTLENVTINCHVNDSYCYVPVRIYRIIFLFVLFCFY